MHTLRSLIHLSHLNSEDALSMRKFYDQVVGHEVPFRDLTPVLVPLIVDKLPKGVVEKWELEIGDHKEDYVKVKTLFAFFEQLIRAKESSQPPSLQSKSPEGVEALTAPVICHPADAVDVYSTKWPHL